MKSGFLTLLGVDGGGAGSFPLRLVRKSAAVALLLCWSGSLAAQTVSSTERIAAAKADIDKMDREELRSLLAYFAECADRLREPSSGCLAAKVRYSTEFGAARPVDIALEQLDKTFNLKRIISRTAGSGTGGGPGTIEDEENQIRTAVGDALKRQRKNAAAK